MGVQSSRQMSQEEELQRLGKEIGEQGGHVLIGRWAGKAGWAIVKGQPIVSMDRRLPLHYKCAVLRCFLKWLRLMSKDGHGRTSAD